MASNQLLGDEFLNTLQLRTCTPIPDTFEEVFPAQPTSLFYSQETVPIGHFLVGGIAYNSLEFLSRWYLISLIDTVKLP